MGSYTYNSLYAKAQLMPSEDEFRVRCREAYETNLITESQYKALLEFRQSIHRDQTGHPTDSSNNLGVT